MCRGRAPEYFIKNARVEGLAPPAPVGVFVSR